MKKKPSKHLLLIKCFIFSPMAHSVSFHPQSLTIPLWLGQSKKVESFYFENKCLSGLSSVPKSNHDDRKDFKYCHWLNSQWVNHWHLHRRRERQKFSGFLFSLAPRLYIGYGLISGVNVDQDMAPMTSNSEPRPMPRTWVCDMMGSQGQECQQNEAMGILSNFVQFGSS